jgi:hypothetical protein
VPPRSDEPFEGGGGVGAFELAWAPQIEAKDADASIKDNFLEKDVRIRCSSVMIIFHADVRRLASYLSVTSPLVQDPTFVITHTARLVCDLHHTSM